MVIDERSDEEPDEPEFAVQSGDQLVPDSPSVEVDQRSTSADVSEAVRTEVATSFWAIVLLLKPAIFGLTLGPLFLYFTEFSRLGIGGICIGVFASLAVYRRYRKFQANPPTADRESPSDSDSASTQGSGRTSR